MAPLQARLPTVREHGTACERAEPKPVGRACEGGVEADGAKGLADMLLLTRVATHRYSNYVYVR